MAIRKSLLVLIGVRPRSHLSQKLKKQFLDHGSITIASWKDKNKIIQGKIKTMNINKFIINGLLILSANIFTLGYSNEIYLYGFLA